MDWIGLTCIDRSAAFVKPCSTARPLKTVNVLAKVVVKFSVLPTAHLKAISKRAPVRFLYIRVSIVPKHWQALPTRCQVIELHVELMIYHVINVGPHILHVRGSDKIRKIKSHDHRGKQLK